MRCNLGQSPDSDGDAFAARITACDPTRGGEIMEIVDHFCHRFLTAELVAARYVHATIS